MAERPGVKLVAYARPFPRADAGRLPAVAFRNALPDATTYHLGMSADAHEESDILVPADVVADPADASAAWRRALKELLGDKHRLTRGGRSVTPLRTASGRC